jgi:predicted nucleotide-binding protein
MRRGSFPVFELVTAIANKKYNNTTKLLIILDSLGGHATTNEIISKGVEAGAKKIRTWNATSLLGQASGRVARPATGWMLLDAGRAYLKKLGFSPTSAPATAQQTESKKPTEVTVAIGHGHSLVWKDLRELARDRLGLKVIEFNSRPTAGVANKERLVEMLREADLAFLVLTAEDEQADGTVHARLNVVHEVGLFQGKLGFEKVAVLVEETCEEFSNLAGLGQIRFPKGNVTAAFEDVRAFVEDRTKG